MFSVFLRKHFTFETRFDLGLKVVYLKCFSGLYLSPASKEGQKLLFGLFQLMLGQRFRE